MGESDFGLSGGPLISLESFKVIGIHKGSPEKGNWNLGTLINEPISEFYGGKSMQEISGNDKFNSNNYKYRARFIEEKLGREENKEIGFDFNLIKRDELYVNLIHFDLNMMGETNFKRYNKFKIDVVGGYFGIDDLEMLVEYLEALKNKNIPFIVLSTRKSGKDVIRICKKYAFIKDFIILCEDSNEYKNCITKYSDYAKYIYFSILSKYMVVLNLLEQIIMKKKNHKATSFFL